MATRKSEWLASIKPILDRDEAKRDAKELAKELSDILEVKVDTDADSLGDLAKEFNQQLVKMGKQQIVFSEKTLHGIVAQFANAITEGVISGINIGTKVDVSHIGDKIGNSIADGIVDGVTKGVDEEIKRLSTELDNLKKERTRLTAEANKIKENAKYSKDFSKIADFDPETAKPLKVPKEIEQLKEMAAKIREEFEDAYYAIEEAEEQGAEAYMSAVIKAKEKHNKLWQMNEVLASRKGNAGLADEIKLYGETLFGEMSIGADFDAMFEEIHDGIENSRTQLDDVKSALTGINQQIDDITNQITALSNSTSMADRAKETLKTFQEIEEAQKRIAAQDKKKSGKATDDIRSAINYVPGDKTLTVLKNAYVKSASSNESWEIQYQWLVKFVKEYDAYTKKINEETDPLKRKNMRATQRKYDALFEQLSPLAKNAEESLNQLLPESERKITTNGETEREKRIETESRVQAEHEIEESLKRQRVEAEKIAKSEERKRELLLQNKEIIAEMLGMSNEAGLFLNSETGETSDILEGGKHQVETTVQAWKQAAAAQLDTRLHKHNYDVAAPSFSSKENDFATWLKGFEYIKKQMILANKEILSFDFSSLSRETLENIARLYGQAAREIDKEFDGYIKDRKVGEIFGTADNMNEQMQVRLREALDNIMVQFPGVMTSYKLPDDMVKKAGIKSAGEQGAKVDKRGVEILREETAAHHDNAAAIKEEAQALENLNNLTQRNDAELDDDVETLAKENGQLEDKLELLRDIAEQYGNNITQKQRDRFEELNQKDMNDGLTAKEDERYWELGEQIEEADSALEEFEQTYDRIIVKLANGKKVEILPDDKGLRTLAKIDEEYGESYNGVEIEDVIYERIQKEAAAAEQAVDSLNDSIEETKNITQDSGSGTGTGDISSAELEAAITKTEALQDEVEQKNKELADKDAEIARIRAESDIEKRALDDAKATLQNDLDETRQRLEDAEYTRDLYDSAMNQLTEESNEKDRTIYDLREQLANVKTGGDKEQVSVTSEELKNVLSSIVYNVKIAHDDADKTANKIAIDEGVLESTLKRVFTNVLNPHTEQNDSEPKNEPWALEKTLQTVKGVLDNIQTNTTKAESVEIAPAKAEAGSVLATENTLAAIKTAVEGINSKVVKGTKATTSSGKQAPKQETNELTPYVVDDDSDSTSAKSNDKSMKLLADISLQRKNLEKFIAQLQTTGKLTDEYQVWIDNLTMFLDNITSTDDMTIWKKAFARTKTSVGIDDIVSKEETKLTKKQALTGKAGNAIGRAEGIWLEAVSLDENAISPEFLERINQYNEQLDALRKKHLEISSSKGPISEEQQKDLIAQTAAINKQTSELSELISEYQRLSGDNVTVIGANTLNPDAGLGAYEQQLKQAVATATNGKAQIKNFDAATKTLTYTVKTGKNEFTEYTAAVRRLGNQLVSVQGTTKRTETFLEATARKMKELTSYFSGMAVFNRVSQELRRGIQYVREIDLALTELRKVTDQTEEEYDQFLQTAAKTGAKLGTTISAVTEATATFAKLGYSMEQATEMAESAIVYKNVGDNIASTEDAADSIISTMKGFKLEATESMAIVDRFNEVGNRFAITSQGIGEALRLSASALSEGGNSLDESIGLITAANEVVNDPSSVGTALKTKFCLCA